MASDDESKLLEPPTVASNPLSIARSIVSSVNPARHTRFIAQRRPVTGAQTQRILPQEPTYDPPDGPPTTQPGPLDAPISREAEEEEDIDLHLQTPGPGSSIS